jgi:hypothetical protein
LKQHIYRDCRIRSLTLISDEYLTRANDNGDIVSSSDVGIAMILTDDGQLRLIDLNDDDNGGRILYIDQSGVKYCKVQMGVDGRLCAINDAQDEVS